MVSLDGDPIMETKQVCDDSPGEVDSVGESAIWTAQQKTHNPCRKSNSVNTMCTKDRSDNETSHVQAGGDITKRSSQGPVGNERQ